MIGILLLQAGSGALFFLGGMRLATELHRRRRQRRTLYLDPWEWS